MGIKLYCYSTSVLSIPIDLLYSLDWEKSQTTTMLEFKDFRKNYAESGA